MRSNFQKRVALLKNGIRKASLDGMLITNGINISYLSGFTGHDAAILITSGKDYFITDSRYAQNAKETISGFSIELVETSTFGTISDIVWEERLKKIGFESMDLPYGVAARLDKLLKGAKILPCVDIVENQRAIKDPEEISLVKASVKLNGKVLKSIVDYIRPGLSESAIARTIEIAFIKELARPAFDPIVASGKNASKPHAIATGEKIRNNSFVMIDIGAKVKGYCSDLTRMITFGRITEKYRKIYDIVSAAQEKAVKSIKPGVRLSDIDASGRSYIQKKGFGKYFGHSLGHGIGMSVHEKPTVSVREQGVARPGMIFTVEPAIYIPGFGGVRIEDMVLVTDKGCEVLTRGERCT